MSTRATRENRRASRDQTAISNPNDSDESGGDSDSGHEDREKTAVDEGMTYTVHASKMDEYNKKLYRLRPKMKNRMQPKPRTKQEELEQHTMSVVPPFTGEIKQRGKEKLEYVSRQLFSELGLAQIRSRDFWIMLLFFLVSFWIRIYVHYFAQWLYLQGSKLPVSDFTFEPVSVSLNYQATLLLTREEIAIVSFGPISTLVIFGFLVMVAWISLSFMVCTCGVSLDWTDSSAMFPGIIQSAGVAVHLCFRPQRDPGLGAHCHCGHGHAALAS